MVQLSRGARPERDRVTGLCLTCKKCLNEDLMAVDGSRLLQLNVIRLEQSFI